MPGWLWASSVVLRAGRRTMTIPERFRPTKGTALLMLSAIVTSDGRAGTVRVGSATALIPRSGTAA